MWHHGVEVTPQTNPQSLSLSWMDQPRVPLVLSEVQEPSGKPLQEKPHITGTSYRCRATRRCLAAVATDVLPRSVPLTHVVVREQAGSWLRASSAAVTAHIHHCHRVVAPGVAVAGDQRDLLLVSTMQPAFSGIFCAPGLQSPPCSDYLLSAQDRLPAEFKCLLYQHREAPHPQSSDA